PSHGCRPPPLPSRPALRRAPPTPRLSPLSLHDALPISDYSSGEFIAGRNFTHSEEERASSVAVMASDLAESFFGALNPIGRDVQDRKSTRLNSSHVKSSYAVFCLKKKQPPLRRVCTRCP